MTEETNNEFINRHLAAIKQKIAQAKESYDHDQLKQVPADYTGETTEVTKEQNSFPYRKIQPIMTVSREMPKYQSHKQVWALKIKEIIQEEYVKQMPEEGLGAVIIPEDEGYAPFEVDAAYMSKHKPKAGGYYVVYDDGYKSWSPAEAFEGGYTKIK